MYQYKYEDVRSDEDPADVALRNMGVADKNLNLAFFISGAQGWMCANKDKSFSDLEKELRKRSFDTHLFAKKIHLSQNDKLFVPSRIADTTEYKYECIFSCRPKKDALEEVLSHWKTYDENLEALKYAWCIGVKDIDVLRNKPNVKHFDDIEMQNLQAVCENKKCIVSEYKSAEKVLSEINATIKTDYGVNPVYKPLGKSYCGPIYVAVVGKKIVSNIGYVEKSDKFGKLKLELVQLQ